MLSMPGAIWIKVEVGRPLVGPGRLESSESGSSGAVSYPMVGGLA